MCPDLGIYVLRNRVVVLDGPFGVARGTPDRWLANGGVTDTQHAKLSWQAIQIPANAVEVGVGSASGQGRNHRILRGCIFRRRFLSWNQQDSTDVGQCSGQPALSVLHQHHRHHLSRVCWVLGGAVADARVPGLQIPARIDVFFKREVEGAIEQFHVTVAVKVNFP